MLVAVETKFDEGMEKVMKLKTKRILQEPSKRLFTFKKKKKYMVSKD